jgi:hypothetical protein
MARKRVLERLGRWEDSIDARFQMLLDARACLEQFQADVELLVLPCGRCASITRTGALDGSEKLAGMRESNAANCRISSEVAGLLVQRLDELLNLICGVLRSPPPCHASCWDLLGRSWPHMLAMQDETLITEVVESISCSVPLELWFRLAEASAWCLHFQALEPLACLEVAEASPAARYVRDNLYNVLLEQRAQLQQEGYRSGGMSAPIWVRWVFGDEGWCCTFDPAALLVLGDVGPGAKLRLTCSEELHHSTLSEGVLCEIIDEHRGRAVARGVPGFNNLVRVFGSSRPRVQILPCCYAFVHAMQREALHAVVSESSPIDAALRRVIAGSWSFASKVSAADAEAFQDCTALAAERPDFLAQSVEGGDRHTASPVASAADDQGLSRCNSSITAEAGTEPQLYGLLTSAQKIAVENALSRRLSLVRGPPGTGKTHVAAVIAVLGIARMPRGSRVLAVTQSHAAALNLHRHLEAKGARAARIGKTLRPGEVVDQNMFSVVSSWDPGDDDVRLLQRAAQQDKARTAPERGSRVEGAVAASPGAAFAAVVAAAPLGVAPAALSTAQCNVMHRMARNADIIVMTCASSGNKKLLRGLGPFPLLVFDEAAQCIEPGPLVPLSAGRCQSMLGGQQVSLGLGTRTQSP